MKTFYEMIMLIEQSSGVKFPEDFEQVLNYITGGSWNLVDGQPGFDLFYRDRLSQKQYVFAINATYRGISESGRHYKVDVTLVNVPNPPFNMDMFDRLEAWKKEFVYDPKGTIGVYFNLKQIIELGPDTDEKPKTWEQRYADQAIENQTPEQKELQMFIQKLEKLEIPTKGPKRTPSFTVYRYHYGLDVISTTGVVELGKQIKNLITKHEKENPSFTEYRPIARKQ